MTQQQGLDAEQVIAGLSQKLASAAVREVMQEVYAEQLEKQIASLQATIRELKGGSNGLVSVSSPEAAREANGAKAKQ